MVILSPFYTVVLNVTVFLYGHSFTLLHCSSLRSLLFFMVILSPFYTVVLYGHCCSLWSFFHPFILSFFTVTVVLYGHSFTLLHCSSLRSLLFFMVILSPHQRMVQQDSRDVLEASTVTTGPLKNWNPSAAPCPPAFSPSMSAGKRQETTVKQCTVKIRQPGSSMLYVTIFCPVSQLVAQRVLTEVPNANTTPCIIHQDYRCRQAFMLSKKFGFTIWLRMFKPLMWETAMI